jgi:hypoxanthine phosphoribosyltransferase
LETRRDSTSENKSGMTMIYCTWDEIEFLIKDLASQLKKTKRKYDCILGVTNGGIVPARLLAREFNVELVQLIPIRNKVLIQSEMPHLLLDKKYLIVDDIYDTGDTYKKVAETMKGFNCDFVFLMSRFDTYSGLYSKILNHNKWIVFPWENNYGI